MFYNREDFLSRSEFFVTEVNEMALKNERIIYIARNLQAGLSDVTAEIRRNGVQVASAAPLSDIGGGRYELLLTPAALSGYGGAGYYDFYINSASKSAPAVAARWILENDEDDLRAGQQTIETIAQSIEAKVDGLVTDLASVKTTVEATNSEVLDPVNGLANIKSISDSIQTLVTNISNVTRFSAPLPKPLIKLESGVRTYKIPLFLYDTNGNMEDPDADQIQVQLTNESGASRDSYLAGFTAQPFYATKTAVGQYEIEVQIPDTALEEQINFKFDYLENTNPMSHGNTTQVLTEANTTGLALETTAQEILADTAAMQPQVADIQSKVNDASFGLSALKALLDIIDGNTDGIEGEITNATYGLSAIRTQLDQKASQASVNVVSANVSALQGAGFVEAEHSNEAIAEAVALSSGRAI